MVDTQTDNITVSQHLDTIEAKSNKLIQDLADIKKEINVAQEKAMTEQDMKKIEELRRKIKYFNV